jgi:hypothetical protein
VRPNQRKPSRSQLLMIIFGAILAVVVIPLLTCLVLHNVGCPSPLACSGLLALGDLQDCCQARGQVAHALGEIDDTFYTNSQEAFELNYAKGFRMFEVDLVLLKDGSAFCAHDGSEWMYGLSKPFTETTAPELSDRLCLGKYTPLTGSALLDLMHEHEDVYFILDTKRTAEGSNHDILKALVSEAKERCPSVLARMIPHTFGPADLCRVADIYPFREYWIAVYSFEGRISRGSATNQDRIVLYFISSGGPFGLMRLTDSTQVSSLLADSSLAVLSHLLCPASNLFPLLSDLKVYASIDTGATSASSE